MPYEIYKVIHLASILLMFTAMGGLAIHAASDHTDESKKKSLKILLSASHGVSLVLILIAGFGLLARLSMNGGWPIWVYIKIVLWILLGGSVALYKRMPGQAKMLFFIMPLIGAVAAGVAIYKPGHTDFRVEQAKEIEAGMKKASGKVPEMADKAKAVAEGEAKAAAAKADAATKAAASEAAAKAEKEASP